MVKVCARSRRSNGKIGDCEQSRVQRTFGTNTKDGGTARFKQKGGKIPERRPNGKTLPKEFSVGHLTDTTESEYL